MDESKSGVQIWYFNWKPKKWIVDFRYNLPSSNAQHRTINYNYLFELDLNHEETMLDIVNLIVFFHG